MEMTNSLFALDWLVVWVSMVLLGWLYIGDSEVSLNEQMITEGYAWEYDGGTKNKTLKNLEKFVGSMVHYD